MYMTLVMNTIMMMMNTRDDIQEGKEGGRNKGQYCYHKDKEMPRSPDPFPVVQLPNIMSIVYVNLTQI